MTAAPWISVIIQCYQSEKYVRETVDSVRKESLIKIRGFSEQFKLAGGEDPELFN